ncbi:MAG: MlaD family protein [Verrucomicrobiota bacterium]
MALQDLTPQLRTRLNRMERLVGWFVFLATALLLFGFGYYLYSRAQSKGWFLVKAKFFTYVNSASGLKVGDSIVLMGFQVGQITDISAMPPRDQHNVRIGFEINQVNQKGDPYYGYVWSQGSMVKVNSSDFLGGRSLEVTRGTNGVGIYSVHPLESLTLAEAQGLADPTNWVLAENIFDESSNLVLRAYSRLVESNLTQIAEMKHEPILAFHSGEKRRHIASVWNSQLQRYRDYDPTNAYELRVVETPPVSDQLQAMISQVQAALPGILALTNRIDTVLDNAANITSNLNTTIVSAQPVVKNFAGISAQLREPGGPMIWALGTNGNLQMETALTNANALLLHVNTNLDQLTLQIGTNLDNVADITSNLNAQVQANPNMLYGISKMVTDSDDFVQGLKRHWLLRSAFKKENKAAAAVAAAKNNGNK